MRPEISADFSGTIRLQFRVLLNSRRCVPHLGFYLSRVILVSYTLSVGVFVLPPCKIVYLIIRNLKITMTSDNHSTVDKDVDDYDKEGQGGVAHVDDSEEPSDFPEGGLRAWMTVAGRFDHMNYTLA
jgi:hypothetical protein